VVGSGRDSHQVDGTIGIFEHWLARAECMEGEQPMPRRQTILVTFLAALAATGSALVLAQDQAPAKQGVTRQQPAARQAQAPQQFPPGAMDNLLLQWEEQSGKLKTLEVDIYRTDQDRAWGDEAQFMGHAAFKSPDLAYVDYKKVKLLTEPDANPKAKNRKVFIPAKAKDGALITVPFETILCTGAEVWHYRYDVQQVTIWPLGKDARKKALDEGPLPFLFRMRAGDAKQRYFMTLEGQDEKVSLVRIQPRMKEDQDVFSFAWVYLDRKFLLPTRILLLSPDKAKTQNFVLRNIKANQPVKQQYFVGVKPAKPWKVEINPGGIENDPTNAKRPRRAGDPQAAQRPDGRVAPR
jgi:TIGR03009 family protein